MSTISKGVTLYTAGTPNGWKVSILLKELNYPHQVKAIAMMKNEQKEDWFLKINPNGRIPAIGAFLSKHKVHQSFISTPFPPSSSDTKQTMVDWAWCSKAGLVDHDNDDFPVFESGAIMMYLAEKAGKFFPQDWNKKSEVVQWVMFQMAGVGPMQGQANHFIRYASEDVEYGKKRYLNETERLYGVLDKRLTGRQYLAGDESSPDGYSIADMITFPWVFTAPWAGIDIDKFPNLKAWADRIQERPAVQAALDVPEPNKMKELLADPEKMEATLNEARKWIAQQK